MSNEENFQHTIINAIKKALEYSVISTAPGVFDKLNEFLLQEKGNSISSAQLELMIENIKYGRANKIPLCQDTGMVNFFVQVGTEFKYKSDYSSEFSSALYSLTKNFVLRPNTVDPFTNKNHGDNLGYNIPLCYFEPKNGKDDLVITVLNKGGGSENYCRLLMLSPTQGINILPKKIKDLILEARGKPCPPIIIGIGIGGDSSKAMYLAKKSLLRPLHSRNPKKEVANLEKKILDDINKLNVGVMGLGGNSTCIDVKIEWAMRHPASFPVGVVIQCYMHRTVSVKITNNYKVEFGYLNENYEFIQDKELTSKLSN